MIYVASGRKIWEFQALFYFTKVCHIVVGNTGYWIILIAGSKSARELLVPVSEIF
jgi:hypothetical protein